MAVQMDPPKVVVMMRRVRRRLALQQWVHFSVSSLIWALGAASGWLLVSRFFSLVPDPLVVLPALGGMALLCAAVWAVRRRPSLLEAALAADARLGLKERFTSSLSLQGVEGAMVQAVHADAERYLKDLDLKRDFPFVASRSARLFIIPLLIFGLGYLLLPELDLFGREARALQAKAQAAALQAKARTLHEAAKALRPEEARANPALDGLKAELEGLAEGLEKQELTEKQALARVTNLAQQLEQQREQLQQQAQPPQLKGDADKAGLAKDVAKDLQNGRFVEAAQKMREMQQKLADNKLSPGEKKQLAQDLKALREMMAMDENELSKALAEALAQAAEGLESGDGEKTAEALEQMQLSMEDLASALEQLAQLEGAQQRLGEWQQAMLGPSGFCRSCGKKLEPCKEGGNCKHGECKTGACSGVCGACAGSGAGLGLGGPGRGQGNRIGELPDEDVSMDPTILPGGMNKGKLLASILQKAAPETAPASEVEILGGDFQAVQQEAEQALTKEEIPAGSKEFVRQYFGTLGGEE